MTIQKIQWKVPLRDPSAVDAWDFFRAFSAWIPDSPEIFIDVADYRHVQGGVKIILVGHYFDVSLDDSDGVVGVVCSTKRGLDGDFDTRLDATLTRTLASCKRLENDSIFGGKLGFVHDALYFTVNDRAVAPNTLATFEKWRDKIAGALDKAFPNVAISLRHLDDPRQLFRVAVGIS